MPATIPMTRIKTSVTIGSVARMDRASVWREPSKVAARFPSDNTASADLSSQDSFNAAPALSHPAQMQRHHDPDAAVENQIDADEKADHPKAGGRPLRQDEHAQHQRDHAVKRMPAPIRQGKRQRADQLEQSADQE